MLTFWQWLESDDSGPLHMPSDLVLPFVRSVGPNGVSVAELHKRFPALKKTLPQLLHTYEDFGWVQWFEIDGWKYVRALI
jgi:hypothetical protein